jgi:hypothetical protein
VKIAEITKETSERSLCSAGARCRIQTDKKKCFIYIYKHLSIPKIKQHEWYVNEMLAGRQRDRPMGAELFHVNEQTDILKLTVTFVIL